MKTIVITGASGHIGGNLVRALLDQGERLRVMIHGEDNPALEGLDVERVKGDVRDLNSLTRAFEGAELIYHLAALISITGGQNGRVHATNVEGARNVAQAALEGGVRRLVHFSSCHAFDLRATTMILDETAPRPSTNHPAYDQSKAAGEAQVRAAIAKGLDAVIVNPSGVIGPNDFAPSRMGEALLSLRDGRLPGLVQGGFDFVDVRDVVRSAIVAAERGRTGESYLLSGHYCTVADLMRLAAEVCGSPAPRLVTPMWLARIGAPFITAYSRLSRSEPIYTLEALHALTLDRPLVADKAIEELGHDPRPLRDSLRDIFASFEDIAR
ncbi:MAG: NAD-dependent epimerase/dehydratase family protein [Polyangiaceae bacterium]